MFRAHAVGAREVTSAQVPDKRRRQPSNQRRRGLSRRRHHPRRPAHRARPVVAVAVVARRCLNQTSRRSLQSSRCRLPSNKEFWLPPGFKIHRPDDPDIEEPGQIAFDGNGRMFVVELRGYMQDADATGELDPVGRISVHEDKNHDGVDETHHVLSITWSFHAS